MMATKADSRTSANLRNAWAHDEAVPLIRSEVREFPSGPEAIKPQQQAGYMRATSLCRRWNFFLATRDGPYMRSSAPSVVNVLTRFPYALQAASVQA